MEKLNQVAYLTDFLTADEKPMGNEAKAAVDATDALILENAFFDHGPPFSLDGLHGFDSPCVRGDLKLP